MTAAAVPFMSEFTEIFGGMSNINLMNDEYDTKMGYIYKLIRDVVLDHVSKFYKRELGQMLLFDFDNYYKTRFPISNTRAVTSVDISLLRALSAIPFVDPLGKASLTLESTSPETHVTSFNVMTDFLFKDKTNEYLNNYVLEREQLITVISGGAAVDFFTLGRKDMFVTGDFDIKFVTNKFFNSLDNILYNEKTYNIHAVLCNFKSMFTYTLLCRLAMIFASDTIMNAFSFEITLPRADAIETLFAALWSIRIISPKGEQFHIVDLIGLGEEWWKLSTTTLDSETSETKGYFLNQIIQAYSPGKEIPVKNSITKGIPYRFTVHLETDATGKLLVVPIVNLGTLIYDTMRMCFWSSKKIELVDAATKPSYERKHYRYKCKLAALIATLSMPQINDYTIETCNMLDEYAKVSIVGSEPQPAGATTGRLGRKTRRHARPNSHR